MTYEEAIERLTDQMATVAECLVAIQKRLEKLEAQQTIQITVQNGVAEVTSKPDFINVEIIDEDNY